MPLKASGIWVSRCSFVGWYISLAQGFQPNGFFSQEKSPTDLMGLCVVGYGFRAVVLTPRLRLLCRQQLQNALRHRPSGLSEWLSYPV